MLTFVLSWETKEKGRLNEAGHDMVTYFFIDGRRNAGLVFPKSKPGVDRQR